MTDEPVAAEVETEVVEAEAESPEVEAEVSEDTETSVTAEAEEKAEPSESSTEKKKDGFQERISELTGEIYQLRQRAEAAEKANEAPPPEPGKTLADFGYDEEKFSGYLTDVAKAEARAEAEQSVSQEAANNRRSAFETLERAYAAENADYMSLTRAMTTPITDVIVAAVETSEKAPEVLHYLGRHPDVATSIAEMHPLDAARELGKIEATKLAKPEPSLSKTPPPPPKVKATGSASSIDLNSPEGDKLSTKEWMKRRAKQLSK